MVMNTLADGFYVSQNGLLVGKPFQSIVDASNSEAFNKNGLVTRVVKVINGKIVKGKK